MRITKFIVALPALFLGVAFMSVPSDAQWYVSGNIGAVQPLDSDYTLTGPGIGITGEFELDTGIGVNGAVGLKLDDIRMEGELSYRQADIDQFTLTSFTLGGVTATGSATAPATGDASALSIMANAWYDIPTGGPWMPFIGGGIGIAQVEVNLGSIAGIPINASDDDTVFAYQIGAGIGYQISPSVVTSLGYRFHGTSNPEFTSGGITEEVQYRSHNIEVGVRFFF